MRDFSFVIYVSNFLPSRACHIFCTYIIVSQDYHHISKILPEDEVRKKKISQNPKRFPPYYLLLRTASLYHSIIIISRVEKKLEKKMAGPDVKSEPKRNNHNNKKAPPSEQIEHNHWLSLDTHTSALIRTIVVPDVIDKNSGPLSFLRRIDFMLQGRGCWSCCCVVDSEGPTTI